MKPPTVKLPPHWCMPRSFGNSGATSWYYISRKEGSGGSIGPGGPTIKEARAAARAYLAANPPPAQ